VALAAALSAVTGGPASAHGYVHHPGYPYPYHRGWGWSVGVGFGFGWPYWSYPYYYSPWVWAPPRPVYVRAGDRERLPATVETKIKPRKAAVAVDGETVGTAGQYDGDWNVLALDPGRHVIEFSAPGFQTLRTVLDARASTHYRIGERLEKGEGLDPRSAPLPEPRTAPESAPPSGAAARRPRPAENPVSPEPPRGIRTGLVWLRVSPADASVYLDGRFLGSAEELGNLHGAIPVARGEHVVDVVMPGYASHSRRITVDGDAPLDVRIDLERERR
jgi:hypothetical protein